MYCSNADVMKTCPLKQSVALTHPQDFIAGASRARWAIYSNDAGRRDVSRGEGKRHQKVRRRPAKSHRNQSVSSTTCYYRFGWLSSICKEKVPDRDGEGSPVPAGADHGEAGFTQLRWWIGSVLLPNLHEGQTLRGMLLPRAPLLSVHRV